MDYMTIGSVLMGNANELKAAIKLEDDMLNKYDSPIEIVTNSIATQLAEQLDGQVLKAVQQYFVDVDKKKLEQALTQDKARYEEAYRRGIIDSKVKGAWIEDEDRPYEKWCSVCWWSFLKTDHKWDVCPNCGCYMV